MMTNVSVDENMFHTYDGIHLRYRTWFPQEPHSVVLLVHGAGEYIEIYEHLGQRLAIEGHAFVTFDLRGFGSSGGQCGHVTHFREYLADLDQLISFFKQKLKKIPFYLIGHSFGGLIVTRYVQYRPHRVNGIVLSAPALGLRVEIPHLVKRTVHFMSRVAPAWSINPYRLVQRVQCIPYLKSLLPYNVRPKITDPLTASRYSFRWMQELLTQGLDAIERAKDVCVPVLCICGAKDELVHSEMVHTFFERLTVKEKVWSLLPDAEHHLLHGQQRAAIETVIGWMTNMDQV